MGIGFSSSSAKNQSTSDASTFVDPNQAPYRNDIMRQAQGLNAQGVPVEGVADLNATQQNAMGMANQGGIMQAQTGLGVMQQGAAQTAGTGAALNYAGGAMAGGSQSGINTAMNAGQAYAGNVQGMGSGAQGSGVNHMMAGNMAGNASQMGAASNNGINIGNAQQIGGLAQNSQAASVNGFNSGTATQAGGLAVGSQGTQNNGFNQNNTANYLNNSVINDQIDAVGRDISRNFRENELTGNASAAAAGGNSGSTRKERLDFGSGQRAADRLAGAASNIRAQANTTATNIEAQRASQNAQMGQQNQQFNAGAQNQMTSQGLGIAGNQAGMNAGFNQQTNLANQNAGNAMMTQGVGVAAGAAGQNAGFQQGANQANMGAQNQLMGQGYTIGANQLQNNVNNQQQASMYNAGQYNQGLQYGTGMGANAYNSNTQNQQVGAGMAQQIGQQGVNNIATGQNMYNTGVGMSGGAGDAQRAYEQELLANQYNQGMSPYNSLDFYNNMVGAPNNLSQANSQSTGKSRSSSFGIG